MPALYEKHSGKGERYDSVTDFALLRLGFN
jgi:hypothetical protein